MGPIDCSVQLEGYDPKWCMILIYILLQRHKQGNFQPISSDTKFCWQTTLCHRTLLKPQLLCQLSVIADLYNSEWSSEKEREERHEGGNKIGGWRGTLFEKTQWDVSCTHWGIQNNLEMASTMTVTTSPEEIKTRGAWDTKLSKAFVLNSNRLFIFTCNVHDRRVSGKGWSLYNDISDTNFWKLSHR